MKADILKKPEGRNPTTEGNPNPEARRAHPPISNPQFEISNLHLSCRDWLRAPEFSEWGLRVPNEPILPNEPIGKSETNPTAEIRKALQKALTVRRLQRFYQTNPTGKSGNQTSDRVTFFYQTKPPVGKKRQTTNGTRFSTNGKITKRTHFGSSQGSKSKFERSESRMLRTTILPNEPKLTKREIQHSQQARAFGLQNSDFFRISVFGLPI